MSTVSAPVDETNPLHDGAAYHTAMHGADYLTLRQLHDADGRISRVRILSEYWPGRGRMCDISYIHGHLADGTNVHIDFPGELMGTPLSTLKKAFIDWADSEGVHAKSIGLLDESNWSLLK